MNTENIEIKKNNIFVLPETIVLREEDNGAFLFDTGTNMLKAVNETGRDIIKLMEGKKSFEEILDSLADEYEDVAKVTIEKDMKAFFTELLKLKLVNTLQD